MGTLCQRMGEDLKLKNYAKKTQAEYLRCARHFAAFYMRSPAAMGEREIRDFLLSLAFRKASPETLKMHVASLKFLYATTLRRPEAVASLVWPKVPHRLPDILSGSEVETLLGAVEPLEQRAVVMTAYGTGLRISEACSLRTTDIDNKRTLIHGACLRGAGASPLGAGEAAASASARGRGHLPYPRRGLPSLPRADRRAAPRHARHLELQDRRSGRARRRVRLLR